MAEETAVFTAALRERTAAVPDPFELDDVDEWRKVWTAGEYVSPLAEVEVVPGPDGQDLPVRVYSDGDSRGVLLHFHSGGFVLGHPEYFDMVNELLCRSTGLAIASVDYRLAPEHRWPAPLEDAIAALAWLLDGMQDRFGTSRVFIGGESAGAAIATAAILRARTSSVFTDWAGAILTYGGYDLRPTHSKLTQDADPIFNYNIQKWGLTQMLGPDYTPQDLEDPELSPVLADVEGFPPTIMTVGTVDPFIDETLHFASRLHAAHVPVDLEIFPGGFHGFDNFPIAIAMEARQRISNWVDTILT